MIHEIEVLEHGRVFVRFTDASLDYGAPDHEVTDQLTPDEARKLADELIDAAIAAHRGRTK